MRKLKTFWYVVNKVATETGYYRDVLKTKLRFSLQFYVVLLFFLSIIDVLLFRVRDVPKFFKDMDQESAHAVSVLPNTFKVSYIQHSGVLESTGMTFPFSIPATSIAKGYGVGDTLATFVNNEAPAAGSFFTLTPTHVIIVGTKEFNAASGQDSTPQVFVYKYAIDTQNFSLTKNQLEGKNRS